MKVVQSFWILPNNPNSHAGGWINKRYEFMSWSLSHILLKNNFSKVELHGNLAGVDMLINTLGLDYTKVNTDLENETAMLQKSWVFGKIQTYAKQNEPFVHVDGDVFWFKPPIQEILNADLVAQSLEIDDPIYRRLWTNCQKYATDLPPCMNIPQAKLAMASNAGIIGGNNINFFHEFYENAATFLEKNTEIFNTYKEDFDYIGTYIEQALFVCFANFHSAKITFLKKPVFRLNFREITDFNTIDSEINSPEYIHLLATYKYRLHYCNLMEFWLYKVWSEQLQKINDLCAENESLSKNCRILLDPSNEKKLPRKEELFFSPKQVIANPFFRTNELLGIEIDNLSEDEIEAILTQNSDNQQINDCYAFEKMRVAVTQYCIGSSMPEKLFAHFEQHLAFCLAIAEQQMDNLVMLNSEKILKSKYNWYNDLSYPTNYYYYNITVSSDGICFQEMLLTELECQLLALLTEKQTIKSLITAWCLTYQVAENAKNIQLIYDTIKELLSHDLIKI